MSADKALPDPRALAALSSLMALIADADGAQARLKQIMAITAEARAEIARAKAASTSLDEKIVAHKATIERETAEHTKRLAAERREHTARLQEREAVVAGLHAKAKADADAVAASKAEWTNLLSRTKAA